MGKRIARIENWRREIIDGYPILVGQIRDHINQNQFKARLQSTSVVLEFDEEKGFAETLNTIYTLGKKMPEDTEMVDKAEAEIDVSA